MGKNKTIQNETEMRVKNLSESALQSHDLVAILELAELYENGLGGEIEKDEKEDQAHYWRTMYNQNDGDYKLASNYEGLGEDHEAFQFLAKAAANGNDKAMVKLGLMYRDSKVDGNNYWNTKDVIELFEKTINNDLKSIYSLGEMYYYGKNVEEDKVRGYQLFEKAANLEYIPAILMLKELQNSGIEIEKDNHSIKDFVIDNKENNIFHLPEENYKKAMYWFKKAAAENNVDAIYNVGLMYDHGQKWGGDGSDNECSMFLARKWYIKAANLGHKEAAEMLEQLTSDMEDSEMI